MFRKLYPAGHYALLLVVCACLYLPALGAPSLWDVDEGRNAQCGNEMFESGNWTVPTFNYRLRVDKPVLLYWLQATAYSVIGVGEFAARLPSAIAAMLTVLATSALAWRMFDRGTGLTAGLVLAGTLLFCGTAHFANPDALLTACTVLTFLLFWQAFAQQDGKWPIATGMSMGLGFLAKGPVAMLLPLAAVALFLLWTRQVRRIFSTRLLAAGALFVAVTVPWFALVGAETHGEYLRGFFLTHNRDRFLGAMEGHAGPWLYHVGSLLVGFLPWSAYVGVAAWYAIAEARQETNRERGQAYKFLGCWIAAYFVFFSISQTKLPNYILPVYPAVAVVIGRFLEQWRRGAITPPDWLTASCLGCWALLGVGTILGSLIAGGVIDMGLAQGNVFEGMRYCAWLGLLPLVGAGAAWLSLHRQARTSAIVALGSCGIIFVGLLVSFGALALDARKAPRALVEAAQARQPDSEVQVACFRWYQPSMVFYCQREVMELANEQKTQDFLRCALPVYLFLPSEVWDELKCKIDVPCRLLARHYDYCKDCEVVVVTNR